MLQLLGIVVAIAIPIPAIAIAIVGGIVILTLALVVWSCLSFVCSVQAVGRRLLSSSQAATSPGQTFAFTLAQVQPSPHT